MGAGGGRFAEVDKKSCCRGAGMSVSVKVTGCSERAPA